MEGNKDSENKTLLLPRHFSTRFTETGEQDRNKARTAQYKKKTKKKLVWTKPKQKNRKHQGGEMYFLIPTCL